MDLTLTPEQELIQTTAREVLRANAATAGVRAVRSGDGFSAGLWKDMIELGWPGLSIPEEFGGVGEGFLESCLLFEELGAAQVPSPLPTTTACAEMPIDRFGTDGQRASWLTRLASGGQVTYAPAAPRQDGDAAGPIVTAIADTDHFTLIGTADLVPFAATADGLLVVARTGTGSTAFLVDVAQTTGITADSQPSIGPTPYCRVRFDDVTVPVDAVLGSAGGGHEVLETAEAFGAAAACAEMVGGARRVLDMTVEHACRRRQFGKPIGTFQAVQHHCANIAIDVLTARFIAYEAVWSLSSSPVLTDDTAMTVSSAKSWVSDAYQRVCALGHQVHGAIGFTAEHDLHLYLLHATSSALAFGDADTHLDRVADALGLPR
ncbi:acyl-CoA dehydrogenase family protein [Amycolatopsis sp. NPDC049868]|uniref:acyl-CoA dehydrogenase family protein n=1 Tax=Amycolatopsis sp. NPDC049868 TaxID=3363934 RepID=UPI003792D7DF